MAEETPNPGSDEALARGCLCAVLDNNHGKYPPWKPSGWWVTEGCPLHWGPLPGMASGMVTHDG